MGLSRDYEKGKKGAMGDLIDRQAAIDALGMAIDVDDFRTATGLIHEATVNKVLDCIPAADVVPVVRCRDCKHWQTDWNPSIPDRHYCAVMDSMMKVDDFCSYGERKKA